MDGGPYQPEETLRKLLAYRSYVKSFPRFN